MDAPKKRKLQHKTDENPKGRKIPKRAKKEKREDTPTPSPASTSLIRQPTAAYDIRKFDPKTMIRPFSTLLFAGGRRTGKSFAMRDFMYHMKDKVYDAQIFSGTYEEDYPWELFVPPKYVSFVKENFPDDVLQTALDRQEERKLIARRHKIKRPPPSLFVFEDLEYLKHSMWHNQAIRSVMFNGRHVYCYAFAAIQYLMEIKMALRGMFDGCCFTFEPSAAVRKRIYDQFGGIFPKFEDFEAVFHEATKDHRCMFIDMRSNSYNVADSIFWYKAEDHGVFKIGAKEIWDESIDLRNMERIELEKRKLAAYRAANPGSDLGAPKPVKRGRGGKIVEPIGVQLDD
jgi:hypothetical protein